MDNTTVVLLRRPETERAGFGFDGDAILLAIDFKVKEEAPPGIAVIQPVNAVAIDEDFQDVSTDIRPIEAPPLSEVNVVEGEPPPPREFRVRIDLDRSTGAVDEVLSLSGKGGIQQTVVSGAVVLEGEFQGGPGGDVLSSYAIQIEVENLSSGGQAIILEGSLVTVADVFEGAIGFKSVVDENSFGQVNAFVSFPIQDPPPGQVRMLNFDTEIVLSQNDVLEFRLRQSSPLDGITINGEPRQFKTGREDDIVTLPSQVITVPTAAPEVPSGINALPGANSIQLSWNSNTEVGLAGYNVYRADSLAGPYAQVGSLLPEPFFEDTGLTNGEVFFYQVSAVGQVGMTESLRSAPVSAVVGQIIMNLPDIRAAVGATNVRLPIGTLNSRGVADNAVSVRLRFPSALLDFVRLENTVLSQGFTFNTNIPQAGELRITGARGLGNALTGEGSLVDVLFNVKAGVTIGQEGQFTFDLVDLADFEGGSAPVDFTDTSKIRIGSDHRVGDIDGNGLTSAGDALLATRIALRQLDLADNPDGFSAGDVNADGVIDLSDVSLIQRLDLGELINPVPGKYDFEKGPGEGEFSVSIGEGSFNSNSRGGQIELPVRVDLPANVNKGIAGLALQINYDPDLLELVEVTKSDLTQDFPLFVDLVDLTRFFRPGVVRLGLSNLENQTPTSGNWFEVTFKDRNVAPNGSETRLLAAEGKLNRELGEDIRWNGVVSVESGRIIFGEGTSATPTHTPITPTKTPTNTPVTPTKTPTNTPLSPTPTPTLLPTAIHPGFDGNDDGIINSEDLVLFLQNWYHRVP